MNSEEIKTRILHLRRMLAIHSHMYYVIDQPIVSDSKWDSWALELARLQKLEPGAFNFLDKQFTDWDGTTGYHLVTYDPWVHDKSTQLLKYHNKTNKAPLV